MFDFGGHTAIVTGAATGIGRAIATCLAENGAAMSLVDIDEGGVNVAAEKLRSRAGKVVAIRADVRSRPDVEKAVADTRAALGDITLLVNNAGIVVIKPYLDLAECAGRRAGRGSHCLLLDGDVSRLRGGPGCVWAGLPLIRVLAR